MNPAGRMPQVNSPQDFVDMLSPTPPIVAFVVLAFGVLLLLWGWRFFKPLAILCMIIVGGLLGAAAMVLINQPGLWLVGMLGGAVVLGVLAWPLTRILYTLWAMFLGVVLGTAVSAIILVGLNLPELTIVPWIGAIAGALLLGTIMVLFFRPCIILLTSFQGAVIVVQCSVALLLNSPKSRPWITKVVSEYPVALLALGLCLFILGFVFQIRNDLAAIKAAKVQTERTVAPIYTMETMERMQGAKQTEA